MKKVNANSNPQHPYSRFLFLLLLLTVVFVGGCARTQVHIFTNDLTTDNIQTIEHELQAMGFETVRNSLDVPEEIIGPTVMYSPRHRNIKQVEQLGNRLLALGYDLILMPAGRSNHFYTNNNVGLYLVPFNPAAQASMNPAGREFNGKCPTVDAYLNLAIDDGYQLEIIVWDEASNTELIAKSTGTWQRNGDIITLSGARNGNNDKVELRLMPFTENTYTKVTGLRLANQSESLRGCDFVYWQHN